jgi:hypothetical protein
MADQKRGLGMSLKRVPLLASGTLIITALAGGASAQTAGPGVVPPGEAESAKTRVLEAGATALQTDAPPDALDVYVMGFHPMFGKPELQVEAHHFCRQVNEDFAHCALYDGNTRDANLVGIEYIISERQFEGLPAEEKKYWHPHNGEILSGQLIAPGLPAVAERELMRQKMNSYGKTWHVWHTRHGTSPGDPLPLGEPELAWSFGREGEADPALVAERDRRMGISTEEKRRERQELVPLAKPQANVDALNGKFGRPTTPIPGVVDKAGGGGR